VFTPPPKSALPVEPADHVETTETLLFRYSAITFNAHRIHYDLAYARDVEKYPGLVVHGPLQATLLMRAATRHAGSAPRKFEFRGVHPMFAGPACDIALQPDEAGGLTLWTGQSGHQCMQAQATWEEAR
jgi:3-methylfumaryl-CoA hydratase